MISSAVFIKNFVRELCKNLLTDVKYQNGTTASNGSWQKEIFQECSRNRNKPETKEDSDDSAYEEVIPFEIIVLDNAVKAMTGKFHQTISGMKPLCDHLLEICQGHPSDKNLHKLSAFKKSIFKMDKR